MAKKEVEKEIKKETIKEAKKEAKKEPETPIEMIWNKELDDKLLKQWDILSLDDILEMFKPFTRKEIIDRHTHLIT